CVLWSMVRYTACRGKRMMQASMGKLNEIDTHMRASVDRMNHLEQRLQDISSLVEVVRSIAAQTNILSLNAGIEAARAGEAGRGFAVVRSGERRVGDGRRARRAPARRRETVNEWPRVTGRTIT